MKIFIIDDNMILSSKLRNQAKNRGYDVKVVAFAKPDILEKIKEFNPDFILLNLESRANDVFDLINKLKGSNFKIIGYCGHTKVDLAKKAKEMGVNFVATNGSIVSHLEEILQGV